MTDEHKTTTGILLPPRQRIYHRAKGARADGAVSALCFKVPRAINLRAAFWTLRDEAVTCPKCLEIINART